MASLSILIAVGAGVFASYQFRQVEQAKTLANAIQTSTFSDESFREGQRFTALLEALKAGQEFKQLEQLDPAAETTKEIKGQVVAALRKAVNGVRERNTLSGHHSRVNSVSWSPDGQTLASASLDKTVLLWVLDFDKLMASGCDWIKDYLDTHPDEAKEERRICAK